MSDNTSITVPRYLLRTLTTKGYFSRFYEIVGASGLNHTEAFEAIENERELFELPPGYDNFQSFKACKSYHRRKLFRLGKYIERK